MCGPSADYCRCAELPLAVYRGRSMYYQSRVRQETLSQLFDLKRIALVLGYRALWKAAERAIEEVVQGV